jgi:hypothetical protein
MSRSPRRAASTKRQPDLVTVLSAELARLVEAEVAEQLNSLESEVADLRKRLAKAERNVVRGGGPVARGKRGATAESAKLTPDSIRALRKRIGISQAELALLAGVTPVAVYFWEAGRTKPTGVNVDTLVGLRSLDKKKARRKVDRLR